MNRIVDKSEFYFEYDENKIEFKKNPKIDYFRFK